jgi:hypothetical protein
MTTAQPIKEVTGIRPDAVPDDILCGAVPVVLRGLVQDWPLARAGQGGPADAVAYLKSFDRGAAVPVSVGGPETDGRVFYNDTLTGPNFRMERAPIGAVLDKMAQYLNDDRPPLIYVGSETLDACLPGLSGENAVALGERNPLVSIWFGTRARIAPHYDLPDNIACVGAGHRRFTLFPPDQLANLYVGPVDLTPAGQPVSLVDVAKPDFDRFPKYREALANAFVAELAPGDAIFIPSMWWHNVESLSPFNVLVNYWWRRSPAYMGPPVNALNHAILAVRDLPPEQKAAWKRLFDHYVFENTDETVAHIPPQARGILGPMSETVARRLRAFLLNRLNR